MSFIDSTDRLQLWGGIECTVNRINADYSDQVTRTGHHDCEEDIARIAELGVEAVRYPVLWERAIKTGSIHYQWEWSDRRLARLQELGISTIVGLVHHGSGPPFTSLLDDSFVEGLADYSLAVASRYPWVEAYTPVNEPLTTARFSALYGHWYPHLKSDEAFATALMNESTATVKSMAAVRKINSNAKFVFTEDLGKVHSTPALASQAAFENCRRWLSIDLLLGKVDSNHPMWDYLARSKRLRNKLAWLRDSPCVPDVLGFNYYITSERFLDERLDRYPPSTHGNNGHLNYADLEAVRVRENGIEGTEALLKEAWQRYRLPMAITEAHLGGQREQQMLWLLQTWEACQRTRSKGIDLRAMTVWNLFGCYDWNSLCTARNNIYESGVFDKSGISTRPTALARVVKHLSGKQVPDYQDRLPLTGWWQSSKRLLRTRESAERSSNNYVLFDLPTRRPILILDMLPTLTQAFAKCCHWRGLAFHICKIHALENDAMELESLVQRMRPWAIVSTLGKHETALCLEPQRCQFNESLRFVENTARLSSKMGVALLHLSSHRVFEPNRSKAFVESDSPCPPCAMGRLFNEMEAATMSRYDNSLIVRTGILINDGLSPPHSHNRPNILGSDSSENIRIDTPASITYIPDLVNRCVDLLFDEQVGFWHLVNDVSTMTTDIELPKSIPDLLRIKVDNEEVDIEPFSISLKSSVLASERGSPLPNREDLFKSLAAHHSK